MISTVSLMETLSVYIFSDSNISFLIFIILFYEFL